MVDVRRVNGEVRELNLPAGERWALRTLLHQYNMVLRADWAGKPQEQQQSDEEILRQSVCSSLYWAVDSRRRGPLRLQGPDVALALDVIQQAVETRLPTARVPDGVASPRVYDMGPIEFRAHGMTNPPTLFLEGGQARLPEAT